MIVFRADSNRLIASGHIMRCMSIAKAFHETGEEVEFLVADENPVRMLESVGVHYTILYSTWNNLEDEIDLVKTKLQGYNNPIFIIDTYQVTKRYVEELQPYARICYLGSKQEYLGRLKALINYSTDIDYEFYRSNYGNETKLLLGPQYAPLRKEFSEVKQKEKNDGRCRVLITTGNTDPGRYVIKMLSRYELEGITNQVEFHVVVGGMFDNKDELHRLYDDHSSIHLHENVKSMSSLMAISDLAISANGTTVYELAAARVPAITFAMVEEQLKSARKLSELGVVDYCGEIYNNEEGCINRIVEHTRLYLEQEELRLRLANKANSVIDGKGCNRIVEELKNL